MSISWLRRARLPLAIFACVFALHFIWLGYFPKMNPVQDAWADVSEDSWIGTYVENGDYWLGFSYGLSLAFAASAFRHYREKQCGSPRTLALGSITFSGFLAVGGCFLLGCCGSPMLPIYLSLLGPKFLPFTKPLVAAISTMFIGIVWWRLNRIKTSSPQDSNSASCSSPKCGCNESIQPIIEAKCISRN